MKTELTDIVNNPLDIFSTDVLSSRMLHFEFCWDSYDDDDFKKSVAVEYNMIEEELISRGYYS